MTCKHCRHSYHNGEALWCELWNRLCQAACADFEREPGSDDE